MKKPCHPDHSSEIKRLKRIQGQLEGIERMIMERRYCIDILNQTKAVTSAIHSLESSLLEKHIKHCVRESFTSKDNDDEMESKILEIMEIFKKRLK
jgi:CsoR family transcriptional regulator, copper-sensing transcriptional repressor